jgi:hypothetical protein
VVDGVHTGAFPSGGSTLIGAVAFEHVPAELPVGAAGVITQPS